MKEILRGVCGAIGIAVAGVAAAADINVPVPGRVVVSPVATAQGFDWSRSYARVQLGTWFEFDPLTFHSVRVTATLGRNFVLGDRFVLGAEAGGGFYASATNGLFLDAMATGRAGVLISDRVLAYATAGFGFDSHPATGGPFMIVGGGVELALRPDLALQAETIGFRYLGDPFSFASATVGVSWYFGR